MYLHMKYSLIPIGLLAKGAEEYVPECSNKVNNPGKNSKSIFLRMFKHEQ